MAERFRDDGTRLEDLAASVDVACPRCGVRAVVRALAAGQPWAVAHRVTCGGCGLAEERGAGIASFGGPVDPVFGLPLWYQAPCCGRRLWAYNAEHVDRLRRFVAATLRERHDVEGAPASLVERLPEWIKAASNRAEVLATIDRLERAG
jgi:hypothetical protein